MRRPQPDPAKSLYEALVRKGQMRTLVSSEDIERAADTPPLRSRAYFRGRVIERFGDQVVAASWQSLTVRIGQRYALFNFDEVDALVSAEIRQAVDEAADVDDLLHRLEKAGVNPEYRVI